MAPPPRVRELKPVGTRATVLLAVAGLMTVLYVASASVYLGFEYFSETTYNVYSTLNLATWPTAIGLYVALCLWQMAVANNNEARGAERPPTWMIWAGWFIPFASWVLPAAVMAKLNSRKSVSSGWIALWWVATLAILITNQVALRVADGSIAFYETIEAILGVSAIGAMFSLWFVVRGISDRQFEELPPPLVA